MVAEYVKLLLPPPQRLPMGTTTVKIAIIEKRKARGGRWEEEMAGAEASLPLFSLPIVPRILCFFLLPSPPYDTKRPLRRKVIKLYYKSIFNERGFSVHNIVAKND